MVEIQSLKYSERVHLLLVNRHRTEQSFVRQKLNCSWALATATFGLIARPKGTTESYRTNMTCWQLGATNSSKPPTIIKQMTFYDICCVSVNNEELNYLPMSQAVMREAKFIYNYYTIETASNINAFIAEAGAGVQAPTPVLPSELDTRILV